MYNKERFSKALWCNLMLLTARFTNSDGFCLILSINSLSLVCANFIVFIIKLLVKPTLSAICLVISIIGSSVQITLSVRCPTISVSTLVSTIFSLARVWRADIFVTWILVIGFALSSNKSSKSSSLNWTLYFTLCEIFSHSSKK